jgi:hypothetical protein
MDQTPIARLKKEFDRSYWQLTRHTSTGAALCMDTLLSLMRTLERETITEQTRLVNNPEDVEASARKLAMLEYVQEFITRALVDKSPVRPLPSASSHAERSASSITGNHYHVRVLKSVYEARDMSAQDRIDEIRRFLGPQSVTKVEKMIEGMDLDQARVTLDQAIMDERL